MVYLDHQATTPCDPRVVEAMVPYFHEHFGNAGSRSHSYGQVARTAVETARTQLALALGVPAKTLVWTSGATESDNIAVLGTARARPSHPHIVTVATEHKAVLDPVNYLKSKGHPVTILPVGADGHLDLNRLSEALRPDTGLVSIMAMNNEIGTLHPLAEIGALLADHPAWFHVDAAQAPCSRPLDLTGWNADLVSLTAHKSYGPKGIGALYVRRTRPKIDPEPLLFGGGQERGLRSGTLPVPLIVGFGEAMRWLPELDFNATCLQRDALLQRLRSLDPDLRVNGSMIHRAPANLNVSFSRVSSRELLLALDGFALSSGSACSSAALQPSHVLTAIGCTESQARGAIRIGLGRTTTSIQLNYFCERLEEVLPELRRHPWP